MDDILLLRNALDDVLLILGIPANIMGAIYLTDAVGIMINSPNSIKFMGREIYEEVAKKYRTKLSNVERAIRHAIDISWRKNRIVMLNDIFHLDIYKIYEKPCNSQVITILARKLPAYILENKSKRI